MGLNDGGMAGTFAWVSGDGSTYRNWNSGEPNNIGTERYVLMFGPASAAPRLWNNAAAAVNTAYGVVEITKPLSALAITAGPSSVYSVSQASYTATATFTDSTTAPVSATWSVNPTTYASIDGGGILTAGWVPSDQTVTVTASFTVEGVTKTDTKTVTLVKQQDTATIHFSDDFESGLGKWEVSGADWATITSGCRSSATCVTDSPSGDYPASANSIITMKRAVNLTGATAPILSFWQKYWINAAAGADWGFVEGSTDGGLSWAVIPGGQFQGSVSTWTNQILDLSSYKGKSLLLRFHLRDSPLTYASDGWYIDDVEIKEQDAQTTGFPFSDSFENGLGSLDGQRERLGRNRFRLSQCRTLRHR